MVCRIASLLIHLGSITFQNGFSSLFYRQSIIKSMLHSLISCLTVLIFTTQAVDWSKVRDQVNHYMQEGAFTGAVLRVANGTDTLLAQPYGHLSRNDLPFGSPSITNSTMFDIASLTKVTATLSCIMTLYQIGKLTPDYPVSTFIPEYANHGKEPTTIKNLLLHNAGLLPDYPPPFPATKKQFMQWLYNCSLDYPIGTKMVYSDLSFILLAEISERITGKPVNQYAAERMQVMGMPSSTYLPDLEENLYRIAPTEYDRVRGLIRGKVHDPTCYLFGGVAGHAGFFSVGQDLETYMQIHLNNGTHRNGTRIYSPNTVLQFSRKSEGLPYENRRALGWDTVPIQTNPPCGKYFSPNSFGHTGYTGTMMWADRDKNLIVVLLTQRVHPTSRNTLVIQARAKIVDRIVQALGYA